MISENQKEIIIESLRQSLRPLKIGIFGSYARDQNRKDSDLDIFVQLDKSMEKSLLDVISAEFELSERLGVKVDLVTSGALSPLIKPFVEKELKVIFQNER